MNKEVKYVAFSTQKGGAGKTTMTVLVASYLHFVKGYNVAVIDCDFPQHSILEMRERDLKMVAGDEYYNSMAYEQFTRMKGRKAYPVIESNPKTAIDDADRICGQSAYDYVFFDLPGTVNDQAILSTLMNMDYIIAPISADRIVLESTLRYMLVVSNLRKSIGSARIKEMYLMWNLVDGREKSELYEMYEGAIKELGLSMLKTFIPDSKRFRKEQSQNHKALFRSTLFPADKSLIKGSKLDVLTNEIIELIK